MEKQIKAGKAEVQAVAAEVIALAAEAGSMAAGISSICDAVSAITRDLHFRAVKVGRFSFKDESKCCPIAKAFVTSRFEFADAVSDSTVSFTLSCFRKAVETGDDYTENLSRKAKAAKAEAAKTETDKAAKAEAATEETEEAGSDEAANDADETIVCAIKKKATLKKAATEIRKMAEKMRSVDGLNLLAAMLIDVVNEIDDQQ